ncbi:MAG: glycosyltransferase family 2 protein [Christensenellaceae bacterium]
MLPYGLCSVIIPAYNCEKYIAEAIQSVLAQTYSHLEVIVIDDCSSDATFHKICKLSQADSRVVALKNEQNIGVAQTRNRGFAIAKGEYIAFLDADDIWLPEKIAMQLNVLSEVNADICCTGYEQIDSCGKLLGKKVIPPQDLSYKRLLKQNFIGCSSVIMRKTIAAQVHMRSEFAHEDYVFWLEALQNGFKLTASRNILMHYRVLPSSRSFNKLVAAKNRWKIYRQLLKYGHMKSAYYFTWYAILSIKKNLI